MRAFVIEHAVTNCDRIFDAFLNWPVNDWPFCFRAHKNLRQKGVNPGPIIGVLTVVDGKTGLYL